MRSSKWEQQMAVKANGWSARALHAQLLDSCMDEPFGLSVCVYPRSEGVGERKRKYRQTERRGEALSGKILPFARRCFLVCGKFCRYRHRNRSEALARYVRFIFSQWKWLSPVHHAPQAAARQTCPTYWILIFKIEWFFSHLNIHLSKEYDSLTLYDRPHPW